MAAMVVSMGLIDEAERHHEPRRARGRGDAIDALAAKLAARQHGAFSRAQLASLGRVKELARRRVTAGRWLEPAGGVFVLASSAPTWHRAVMIAHLAWGPGSVVSHRAAAALRNLAGVERPPVELTVPRGRKGPRGAVLHRAGLEPGEVGRIGPFEVTRVERTLVDLAAVLDAERLEIAVEDALRRRLTTLPRLAERLARTPRRPGIAAFRALVAGRAVAAAGSHAGRPLESPLEVRLSRLIRGSDLPPPAHQHEVRTSGRLVARVDLAYPDRRLAIEADGLAWHTGRVRFERDRERLNRLALAGWRVIHVTASRLEREPGAVLDDIRSALAE